MGVHELDQYGSEYGQVAAPLNTTNELWHCTKCGKFFD